MSNRVWPVGSFQVYRVNGGGLETKEVKVDLSYLDTLLTELAVPDILMPIAPKGLANHLQKAQALPKRVSLLVAFDKSESSVFSNAKLLEPVTNALGWEYESGAFSHDFSAPAVGCTSNSMGNRWQVIASIASFGFSPCEGKVCPVMRQIAFVDRLVTHCKQTSQEQEVFIMEFGREEEADGTVMYRMQNLRFVYEEGEVEFITRKSRS